MPDPDRYLPARLLSQRAAMSRLEQDAIFEQVAAAAQGRRTRAAWFAAGFATVAVAAAVLVVPRLGNRDDELTARGGGARGALEIHCVVAGAVRPCATGATMAFEVTAPPGAPYFAAYARRADGTVIWYLPETPAATSHLVSGSVIDTGIVLGAEHPAGHYEVEAIFSPRPLTRAEIRALPDAPSRDISRVHRALDIR